MSKLENSVNLFFDVLAALISISDVATDVIVTYNFYIHNEMVFFWLSITFIILAQISYAFAFVIVIGDDDHPLAAFLLFLCVLPLAPFLSFVFYLTEDQDSCTAKWLKSVCCLRLRMKPSYIDPNKSKLKQWMKKKLRKHLGFILEALIEAFPQSIIQISAIVIHGNVNVISIVSILISMLSVSSKAFIFAIQFSVNIKSLLFIWIGAVTDFIGVFFAISWVLYDSDIAVLSTLSLIWQIKVCVCVVPLVLCFSVFMYVSGLNELLDQMSTNNSIVACCFGVVCAWLVVQILWCFGMVLGTMGLEIATFIFFTPPIMLSCDLVPSTEQHMRTYLDLIAWIIQGRSQRIDNLFSVSSKQDRIVRTCVVNKAIIDSAAQSGVTVDIKFKQLINDHYASSFLDVPSFALLRTTHQQHDRFSGETSEFGRTLLTLLCVFYVIAKNEAQWINGALKKKCCLYGGAFANFGIAPLFFVSRVFNMLFPFLIIVSLYRAGYNVFGGDDIALFQRIMLWLYVAFIAIFAVIGGVVYREQYYLWHILPGKPLPANIGSISVDKVTSIYQTLISVPVRDALLHKTYGSDIAKIIILYCNAIELD